MVASEIIHLQRTILSGVVANETLGLHWKFDLNQRYFRHPLHKKIIGLQHDAGIEPLINSWAKEHGYEHELIEIIAKCPVVNWARYYELLIAEYEIAVLEGKVKHGR